ncbi:MAG: hypothetical protein A3G41_01920 [Elusimicrobia bacterium RIFCSPLOWO2_12_FULL_59_9]|nr:MAG: hypothetical protein A3G41_01920 [Elusimicrobia bacterium RIFCSPLOWO2_12_FULL_59_9]
MRIRNISVGGKAFQGVEISLPEAPLVLALGRRGYLMCGYLNLEAADKFRGTCAVVRGVSSVEDILRGKVSAVSRRAKRLGVRVGMRGAQAIKKFL